MSAGRAGRVLLLAGILAADEPIWAAAAVAAEGSASAAVGVPLPWGGALQVAWTAPRAAWMELAIECVDGRRFRLRRPLALQGRLEATLPLDAATFAGDGPLGADALLAVRSISAVGADLDGLELRFAVAPAPADDRIPAVLPLESGVIDRGPWREWRFRLAGGGEAARPRVRLDDEQGIVIPAFRELPGRMVDGRWRPSGPERWVLRLRAAERPRQLRIEWPGTARAPSAWISVADGGREALPAPPPPSAGVLPLVERPAGVGDSTVSRGGRQMLERGPRPAALAPLLAWRGNWTGFRGPRAVSHAQAALLDARLAAGAPAIDLLSQALAEEQGTFRRGTAPWSAVEGSILSREALDDLAAQAEELLARCRAAPGLQEWQATLSAPVARHGEGVALLAWLARLGALVADIDGRPLRILQPLAAPYRRNDPTAWFDFRDGVGGWQLALPTADEARSRGIALLGRDQELHVELGSDPRAQAAIAFEPDANLFNLDRLECDVALDGGGLAAIYLWATDQHHRFYQQRLDDVPGDGRRRTLTAAFHGAAPFLPVGHGEAWSDDARRRIRRLGLLVCRHAAPGSTQAARARFDSLVRRGWPEGLARTPAWRLLAAPPERAAQWSVVEASFAFDVAVMNPYDPAVADVRVESRAPDGRIQSHPAYWHEPMELRLVDGTERAVPSGAGSWRWRRAFDAVGAWQWRVVADLHIEDARRRIESPWSTLTVGPAQAGQMLPVRRSADPRWWETADGRFFYPMGPNIRSPGENLREDLHTRAKDEPQAAFSVEAERLGTQVYERFFTGLAAGGGNYARVWMAPWWVGIEWSSDFDSGFNGLTNFHQGNAAKLDRLLELARAKGIHLELELNNHGSLAPKVDSEWAWNPYNRDRGGMCARPAEFFTSEAAWEAYAKRLRYIVARWGADSSIMAWSLCSEMEFTGAWWDEAYRDSIDGRSPSTIAWVRRHLAWLAENDHHPRPSSVHISHPWRSPGFWREIPELGFSYANAYSGYQRDFGQMGGSRAGMGAAMHHYINSYFPPWELGRPAMVGEWGGHWSRNEDGRFEAELPVGVWLQGVLPFGGNTGFWWWLWMDRHQRWNAYAPVRRFLGDEDPRGHDLRPYRPSISDGQARAFLFGSRGPTRHRYYAWLAGLDRDAQLRDARDAGRARIDTRDPGSRWRIERWDTAEGRRLTSEEQSADAEGVLILALGILDPSAAFKLERLQAGSAAATTPAATAPAAGAVSTPASGPHVRETYAR